MLNKLLTRRAVNPSEMSSVNSLRSPFDPVTPGDAGDWGEPWVCDVSRVAASREGSQKNVQRVTSGPELKVSSLRAN